MRFQSYEKAMELCIAQCKCYCFVETLVLNSHTSHLKKTEDN